MCKVRDELIEKLDQNKLQNYNFEQFTRLILDKSIIEISSKFLQEINKKHKIDISPRLLLGIYLIYYHHNDVLSGDKSYIEYNLYKKTRIVIDYIYVSNFDQIFFAKLYQDCLKIFNFWKVKDRQDLLEQMNSYHSEINSILKLNGINDDKNTLNQIEDLIKKIGGNLENNKNNKISNTDIIINQVIYNFKQAFWEKFKEDLSSNPPNFVQYPKIVEDVYILFTEIIPNQHKKLSLENLKKNLDSSLIERKIKSNKYTIQDIYNLLSFCLYSLLELHNQISLTIIQEKIKHLDKDMQDSKNLSEICPNYFKFIIEQLEIIKEYKNYFNNNLTT